MLAAIRARVGAAHAALRGRRLARRQRAAQLARPRRRAAARARSSRGRRGVGAARPHRRRASRSARASIASTRGTSCDAEAEEPRDGARAFPGLLDAARVAPRAHDVRVRRRRHRAAARLRRRGRLLARARRRKPWLAQRRACRRWCSTRATIRSCRRASLPGPAEVSAAVRLEQPDDGGHVGLRAGPVPGRLDWLPRRLLRLLRARALTRRRPAAFPRPDHCPRRRHDHAQRFPPKSSRPTTSAASSARR